MEENGARHLPGGGWRRLWTKEEEKLEEMFEAEATKQWSQDDDAIFDQYAQMCLDEYVAQGKNPKPIELVMKKIKQQAD